MYSCINQLPNQLLYQVFVLLYYVYIYVAYLKLRGREEWLVHADQGATLYRTMYNLVTTLLQPCYKLATVSNTSLLQACYNLVTTLLQPCTTRLQQACDKVVTSLTFPYGQHYTEKK